MAISLYRTVEPANSNIMIVGATVVCDLRFSLCLLEEIDTLN